MTPALEVNFKWIDPDWGGHMHNADFGDMLYDDATHSNTKL